MALQICPTQKSDLETVAKILFAAYKDFPTSRLMYPGGLTPSILSGAVDSTRESWGKDPLVRRMQVKDTKTGEIISFSQWNFLPERKGDEWRKIPEMKWPDDYDGEAATKIQVRQINKRHDIMGTKPYICKYDLDRIT